MRLNKKKKLSLSEEQISTPFQYFQLGEGIVSIPKILCPSECEQFIRNATDQTFVDSKVGDPSEKKNLKKSSVRNSEQLEFTDENLAKNVYDKCEGAIKQLVGWESNTLTKFSPVKIDSNWKLYRYKKGQHFDSHIDSGRKVGDLFSFITVLIYLNGDLKGGETVFEDDDVIVEPEEGKCVLFLHQIKHSAKEITGSKSKFVIKSAVLFEKNEAYEKSLNERFGSSNIIESPIESIIVEVGGGRKKKEFELNTQSIAKYPDSMLYTLVTTSMTGDVVTNEKGVRIFRFPSQNPTIFKNLILPIFQQTNYLDVPIDSGPTQQLEIDNEFKFWGLLSPFDEDSISKQTIYSNKQEPWKSTELLLISKALESTLNKRKQEIEGKLAILKAIRGIKEKLKHNFSYDKKNNVRQIQKHIQDNLQNKYEVIPLKNLYDNNFFLLDSDREIYETCIALFGTDCVSLGHLKFVVESREHGVSKSTICDRIEDDYSFHFSSLLENLEQKGITKPEDIEEGLDKWGITMSIVDIMSIAKTEHKWEGEYNDEYCPSYSLFSFAGIFINVKQLQGK